MPREHIWGDVVTVHRGDLPVLRARTTRDLTASAALPCCSPAEAAAVVNELRAEPADLGQLVELHNALVRKHRVLRRRHQLLSRFVDELVNLDDSATGHVEFTREFRRRAQALLDALEALPLDDPDVAAYGPSLPLDEVAELALLRKFAHDVGQANAADDFPAIARSRLTPLVNQLARELLELRRPPRPAAGAEPTDDAAPLTDDAERAAEDELDEAARRRWAEIARRPRAFRRDPADPVTTGPGWRTPHPDCPRRDYVHAGHRDPLPNNVILDCPGLGPTYDAVRDYAAGHGPDPALDAPDPTPDDLVQLQLALVLTWIRDGGHVTLGVVGHDHATGEEHDVGGFHLTLDWAAANKLIKKTRVARDQSHGAPE